MMQASAASLERLRTLGDMPDVLADLARRRVLREALARAIPEFATGRLSLERVTPRRLRLDRSGCIAIFDLTVRSDHGEPRRIRVAGTARPGDPHHGVGALPAAPLGDAGWRCGVPELRLVLEPLGPDAALPALSMLMDASRARRFLESAIRAGSPGLSDLTIARCEPTMLRHREGSRCTIVYELDHRPGRRGGDWPSRVVAKTHRGAAGAIAFDGMHALWNSPLRTDPRVAIAEPLAYIPDLKILLQRWLSSDSILKDRMRTGPAVDDTAALGASLEQTGLGLAALHRCGAQTTRRLTWREAFVQVRRLLAGIAAWSPGTRNAGEEILARLDTLAGRRAPQPDVPSHGSFLPGQVLVRRTGVGFIDFDHFGRAEPAMDVAMMSTNLSSLGLRRVLKGDQGGKGDRLLPGAWQRIDEVEGLCERFLDGYASQFAVDRGRVNVWRALFQFANVLKCWQKVRPDRVEGELALLEHRLRELK